MWSMIFVSVIVLSLFIFLLLPVFARILHWCWQQQRHYRTVYHFLQLVYQGVNGDRISCYERRAQKIQDSSLTYGEITFYTFIELLELIQPSKEDIFYDLGCGVGKTVLTAALLFPIKRAIGIEKLEKMAKTCGSAQYRCQELLAIPYWEMLCQKLKINSVNSPRVQFIQEDIAKIDLQDASIIFINATCFYGELWQQLVDKFKTVKPGCRIVVSSRKLVEPCFQLLDSHFREMSWGLNAVNIYTLCK